MQLGERAIWVSLDMLEGEVAEPPYRATEQPVVKRCPAVQDRQILAPAGRDPALHPERWRACIR